MNVAFYGGSFDPPHVGHVLAAAYLLAVAGFDRVLVVPVFEHAFAKPLLPFADRLSLCQLAFARLGGVQVSPIESELPHPNYTLDTLRALQQEHPDWQLRLVIGSDVLKETGQWRAFDEVRALAPLLVLGRHGYPAPEAPLPVLPDISSSRLRAALATSSPGARPPWVRESLVGSVLKAIDRCGLYR